MRKLFLLSVTLLIFIVSEGQNRSAQSSSYRTALGIRVWDGAGITLKHFFNERDAGDFILYFWNHGFRFTGLYEIHGNFADARGLKWYIGPGAHVGFYDYWKNDNHVDGAYFGIDGVLGLDYKFTGAPINLSLDWQPGFEFGDYVGFFSRGGFSIRYTF